MTHIVIWSKPDCQYCTLAKMELNNRNIPFEEKVLGRDFTKEILLEAYPTAKSFPVVVVDGFFIGGYSQLNQRLSEEYSNKSQLLNE